MRNMLCWMAVAVSCAVTCAHAKPSDARDTIEPGQLWLDTDGVHINAHGGGVLYHDGVYYWYGEHKTEGRAGNVANVGVRVYRSTDLANWENAGVALAVDDDEQSEIVRGSIIERPKVLYNEGTGKFVMWFHLELKGHRYNAARTGCAIADAPTGPFSYLGSVRPNAGRFPVELRDDLRERVIHRTPAAETPTTQAEQSDDFFVRDFYGGQMARDMTLFLDDDGTAYHVFASEENLTLHIAELDETFTKHTGRYARVLVGEKREAPALFKRHGRYHLITSGCTGWAPNAAGHAVADSIWGPWTQTGNPCVGEGADLTFRGQSTFVLSVAGRDDTYIFMADRWNPENAIDGRYIWLPIEFDDGVPVLQYRDVWRPQLP